MQNDEEWHGFYETQAALLKAETLSESRSRSKRIRVGSKEKSRDRRIQSTERSGIWTICAKLTTRIYQPAVRVNGQLVVKGRIAHQGEKISKIFLSIIRRSYSFALIPRIWLQFGNRLIRIQ
jgi:hypothetical protein